MHLYFSIRQLRLFSNSFASLHLETAPVKVQQFHSTLPKPAASVVINLPASRSLCKGFDRVLREAVLL